MMYWENHEKARALRAEANQFMDANNIAPTPAAYELFFHYRLGADRELRDAIEAAAQSGKPLSGDVLEKLHARFFSQAHGIDEATVQLEKELKELTGTLQSTGEGSLAYGRTLGVAVEQLARTDVPPQVQGLIEGVASATRLMAEANKALEMRVESSTKEIEGLRKKMESLRRESLVDALTGLANRRAFDESLKVSVAEAEQEAKPLCVLMCDIDHFKKFNDTWGHATGDQVLRLVAQCVSSNVKGRDTAARYGGEELVVILPNTGMKDAATVAEQIRRTVETRKIVKKSTGESYGSITLSIGVSELKPGETIAQFLERADVCLYEAKRSGRNRVCTQVSADEQAKAMAASKKGTAPTANSDGGSLVELQFPDQQTEICVDPEVTLQNDKLKQLYAWWGEAAKSGIPVWSEGLFSELGFIRSSTHLYQVGDGGTKFLIKQVGADLIALFGGDPSGYWIPAAIADSPKFAAALTRVFEVLRLTTQMKAPIRTFSKATHVLTSGAFKGETVCLPFSVDGQSVDYLLTATIMTRQATEQARVA